MSDPTCTVTISITRNDVDTIDEAAKILRAVDCKIISQIDSDASFEVKSVANGLDRIAAIIKTGIGSR
jgi:hypothetical protein